MIIHDEACNVGQIKLRIIFSVVKCMCEVRWDLWGWVQEECLPLVSL